MIKKIRTTALLEFHNSFWRAVIQISSKMFWNYDPEFLAFYKYILFYLLTLQTGKVANTRNCTHTQKQLSCHFVGINQQSLLHITLN